MRTYKNLLLLLSLLLAALLLSGCELDDPDSDGVPGLPTLQDPVPDPPTDYPAPVPATDTALPLPTETAVPAPPGPTAAPPTDGQPADGVARIDRVEVVQEDGQVQVTVAGQLRDACTQVQTFTARREGEAIYVDLVTVRPQDAACAQVLTPFEQTFPINTATLVPGTYSVIAGEAVDTFVLETSETPRSLGTVTISPTSGPPETTVRLLASGFPANTAVQLGLGPAASEYEVLRSIQTNAQGQLDTQITMPESLATGDRYVAVVVYQGQEAVSNPFAVTTANAQFTQVDVFLVALDQGGAVGCGDTLVPVQIAIEPTIAPLRASIEQLLAIDQEFYGQSGLYNALYQSDLQVQGVDIDNGQATIALQGQLLQGGVCDSPRIEAQLQETARQFSTVETVTVLLNGQPLEQVLSGAGG